MSNLQRLIRREIGGQRETRVGTVISEMKLTDFDGNGSGVWVCNIEIGANNFLVDVPVKALRNRFHAQLGQTVLLRRNAQGRFEVIGPGDRLARPVVKKTYDLTTGSEVSSIDLGFSFNRVAFSFYATSDLTAPLDVLWADGVTPFNLVRIVDAQGNPV